MPLIYEKESYKIIGAAQEVHRVLGAGFLEKVYQDALEIEFSRKGISYQREPKLEIDYKGDVLASKYQPDFICHDKIIVELKALNALSGDHTSQVINYLKVTKFKLAILFNFGEASLKTKRLVK